MLIDWFTVVAQGLNFLVLIWLLKRFLYKPVLNAIDAREKKIAGRLASAEQREAEALREKADYEGKIDAIDQERADLLKKATAEATEHRTNLIAETQKAADELAAQRRTALHNEARDLATAIGERTRNEVFTIARATLKDLAATDLEERMCMVFIDRLATMDAKAKGMLAEAIRTAPEAPLVRSAFDLPQEQRTTLQEAVNKAFDVQVALRFATIPDLVAGIELSTNGQKIAWSIDEHLDWLSANVDALIGKGTTSNDTTLTKNPT